MTDSTSAIVTNYAVTTADSSSPVSVAAQTFTTIDGILILSSDRGQPVAAFASGQWKNVQPGATS